MKACPQCNLKYPSDKTACFVDGSTLVEIQDPRIGTTIAGRYLIESVIGEGGMATVYKARHRLIDRPCAVKIMNQSFAGNEVIRERFRREAKAAQKLAHPNIIEISDYECPYCQRAHGPLMDALAEHDDVRLIFKHMPLPMHAKAIPAARAAWAA